MGDNLLTYSTPSANTESLTSTSGSCNSYFSFVGPSAINGSGGFRWAATTPGAVTVRFPIGLPNYGFRPVTINEPVSTSTNLTIGFDTLQGGINCSAINIPTTNMAAKYIAYITTSAALGATAPNISMEYLTSDINGYTAGSGPVNLYNYAATGWNNLNQTSAVAGACSDSVVTKNAAVVMNSANLTTPFNLAVTNTCPTAAVNYTWVGGNTGDPISWTEPLNWSPNTGYPHNATDNVTIGAGTSQPTLNASGINIGTLTLSTAAANLTLGGDTLSVNGNLTITAGTITSSALGSAIKMDGPAAQTITNTTSTGWTCTVGGGTTNRLLNLIIDNPAGVSIATNAMTIVNALTITQGTLTTGGFLTLGVSGTAVTLNRTAFGALSALPTIVTTAAAPYNVNYFGSSSLTTSAFDFASATQYYGTLSINTASGTTVTQGVATANFGAISVAAGTYYNIGANILTLASASGGLSTPIANSGTIIANATSATIILGGTLAQSGVNFGTLAGGYVANLQVNNTGGVTMAASPNGNVTVFTLLTIGTGATLADNGNTITINGGVTNNGTHTSTGSGSITLTGEIGNTAHALSGSPAIFGNLTLNDPAGATFTSSGTWVISHNLYITNGTAIFNAFTTSFKENDSTVIGANGTLSIPGATNLPVASYFTNVINNGTWLNSMTNNTIIAGNLANNGAFGPGTGYYVFTGNPAVIYGISLLQTLQTYI